ncbi:MAG TPA: cyclase family protein [Rhodothermales bacterium]|nr:cyclase family protein [Rhodothermales bacterium]
MRTQVKFPSGRTYSADLRSGVGIGIPLEFDAAQPNAFGAPPASAKPFSISGHVLDTAQGGSCNVSVVTVNPHCNGTHTESVRHITGDGPSVMEVVPTGLIGATLISVEPELGSATAEQYSPPKRLEDRIITKRGLESLCSVEDESFLEAVVVRTIPNDPEKLSHDYSERPGPYLSIEAIQLLLELGVSHLLVDTASVDRADDEGRMRVHRLWFGIPDGTSTIEPGDASHRTITEMIYVPESLPDGPYLLQIQVAPFALDASPSRPVLFRLTSSF